MQLHVRNIKFYENFQRQIGWNYFIQIPATFILKYVMGFHGKILLNSMSNLFPPLSIYLYPPIFRDVVLFKNINKFLILLPLLHNNPTEKCVHSNWINRKISPNGKVARGIMYNPFQRVTKTHHFFSDATFSRAGEMAISPSSPVLRATSPITIIMSFSTLWPRERGKLGANIGRTSLK